MEKQDLSKILIKDSEYYNPNCSYVGMLKKNNITTIDQILDDSFLKLKCKGDSWIQLNGLISMLKYKYLGEPLSNDVLLDKEIDLESLKMGFFGNNNLIPLLDEELRKKHRQEQVEVFQKFEPMLPISLADIRVNFSRLLGCPYNVSCAIVSKLYFTANNHRDRFPEKPKLIDFLKYILTTGKFERVYPFINTYIEVYEKNQSLESSDMEAIKLLKEQLGYLIKTREELDFQITNLQQQIKILKNSENKGGIKR